MRKQSARKLSAPKPADTSLGDALGKLDSLAVSDSTEAQSGLALLGIVQAVVQNRRERPVKKPVIKITRTKISQQSAAPPLGPLLVAGQDGLPRFTRGKHEGKTVKEVSTAYLDSLLRLRQLSLADDEIVSTEYWTRRMGRSCTFAEAREQMLAEIQQIKAARQDL